MENETAETPGAAETTDARPMRLCYRNARGERDSFALSRRPRTTIGRELSCDVVFASHDVSRRHASIELVLGQHFLRDLESANGTFLNGLGLSRGHAFVLREGDVIEIGSESLTIAPVDEGAPAPASALPGGTCATFPAADLVRDGFARLRDGARTELQTSIQKAFVDVPEVAALERTARLVAERLSVETVAIFMEARGATLVSVAARPSFEAAARLAAMAERACATDEGRLAQGLAPVQPGPAHETCFQATQSVAAVPFAQGPRVRGAVVVERLAGKRLDRSDLALLAVLSDRLGLMLSLSQASMRKTVPG